MMERAMIGPTAKPRFEPTAKIDTPAAILLPVKKYTVL